MWPLRSPGSPRSRRQWCSPPVTLGIPGRTAPDRSPPGPEPGSGLPQEGGRPRGSPPLQIQGRWSDIGHIRLTLGEREDDGGPGRTVRGARSRSTGSPKPWPGWPRAESERRNRDSGDGVKRKQSELAKGLEEHELAVWTQCVDAVAMLPGNPLGAVIDRSGRVPLVALGAVDRGDINRVIALGVDVPARAEDVESVCSFYEAHHQQNFRIELTPFARPSGLADWMSDRGLSGDGLGTFKMWRRSERPPPVAPDIDVRRLGPADRDALTAVNVAAWGAWSMPVSMAGWFGATVGSDGVHHYGAFEADRLVATGALFIGDGIGWLGFDATHPRYQGKKLRQAISTARMIDAVEQGCSIVHAESAFPLSERALRDGWTLLYEKKNFAPVHGGGDEVGDADVAASGCVAPGGRGGLPERSDGAQR
jgi:hypothetical protein